jgi:hypothetical protein
MFADYRPEPGFVGSDYFSIDIIYVGGGEKFMDFYVNVK